MAQHAPQKAPSPSPPPQLESASESLPPQDLQKRSPPIDAEEKLKEAAFTVIQKDTPLEPSPPESSHPTMEKDSAHPLAADLAVPQESHSPIAQSETEKQVEKKKVPESLVSFKEESNNVADLSDYERNALEEFKILVQQAISNRVFSGEDAALPQEVSIWGVPLLKDDRTEVILLKFLRARDFKVKDSLAMLKNTIRWRRDFKVDELLKEDLGDDLEKVVFMHGHDKEGHSVCYNVYGEFQNKELYNNTFADEDKRTRFLRRRIQFLERSIRKLDFSPGGINTIFQVSDLKNSPGPGKKELRIATKQALQILQDNYPEFVAKQVFINVPWWYLAFYTMISPFLTQRTKSKFVFAGPTKTAETLFKYISPEQVPTQYGGLSVDYCECNPEFTVDDPATEIIVKPATKQIVEITVNEKCTLVWELRVVGWEVSYGAEYIPKRGYTILIDKNRKMAPNDEPVISHRFDINELGKILLTVDNPNAKKKKLLYRFKVVPYADS